MLESIRTLPGIGADRNRPGGSTAARNARPSEKIAASVTSRFRFLYTLSLWPVLRDNWRREGELWTEGSLACTRPVVAAFARGGPSAAMAQMWRGVLRMLHTGVAPLR